MTPLTESERARFYSYLVRDTHTGCLIWAGQLNHQGYGVFRVGSTKDGTRRKELAHRVAWVLVHGSPPVDKPCVLHDCPQGDTPACCEPLHLWVGTRQDNAEDRNQKSARRALRKTWRYRARPYVVASPRGKSPIPRRLRHC